MKLFIAQLLVLFYEVLYPRCWFDVYIGPITSVLDNIAESKGWPAAIMADDLSLGHRRGAGSLPFVVEVWCIEPEDVQIAWRKAEGVNYPLIKRR